MDTGDFRGPQFDAQELGRALRRFQSTIVMIALAIPVLLLAWTSLYLVDASDEGVVLRFGKYDRTAQPGLHLKFPWPIEQVHDVPVRRIQTLEFGFATAQAGRKTTFKTPGLEELDVSDMLTGDLNLAHVEWIVQYRISDPQKYLFNIGDVEGIRRSALPSGARYDANAAVPDTIRNVSESVLRQLVGDTSIDSVLTFDREKIAAEAKLELQRMLDDFNSGVEILAVKLQSTSPPEEVKDAFQEVNRARQNKERVVNEAEGERNRQIPAARGRRDQTISEAEGYRDRVVLTTKGQIDAFLAKLTEYEKARDVTMTRLYLEAMEEILAGVDQKTIVDESLQNLLPLLNLDAESARSTGQRGGVR